MDKLTYTLQRSNRKSIGFTINSEGLKITAPYWVSQELIDKAILSKKSWIEGKLQHWQHQQPARSFQWQPGMGLPYLGKTIIIQPEPGLIACRFSGHYDAPQNNDTLYLNLPANAAPEALKKACNQWFQGRALAWFDARLRHFHQTKAVKPSRYRLSGAQTRWGSCSSDGSIRLNWRLIHLAPELIDYVIAHELAHLKEMNHSPRFWAEVKRILPEFEAAKNVLRQQSLHTLPII
ncbi:MAG: M48 family metallopeptidase [Alcaligenaceae bacterium]|nr:M48 family metallopeptidase [Alcaligenaceae bacterium]